MTTRSRTRQVNSEKPKCTTRNSKKPECSDPVNPTDQYDQPDDILSDSDDEITFKQVPNPTPDILDQRVEDIMAPIEPQVEDTDEEITSYSRRSTLIGHQLNQPINPFEVPDTSGAY